MLGGNISIGPIHDDSSAASAMCNQQRAVGKTQDGWQQQRELTLLYMRFYAVLLLGIMLTYQLQK
jgi:hypothetical protein